MNLARTARYFKDVAVQLELIIELFGNFNLPLAMLKTDNIFLFWER